MRARRQPSLRGIGIGPRERVPEIIAEAVNVAARRVSDDLPPSMAFALLYLRRNVSPVTANVVEAMQRRGIRFTVADFDQLRMLGLVDRPPGSHHVPTDAGMREIAHLTVTLGERYMVHHVTVHRALPRSNMGAFASCACRGWSYTVGRSAADLARLERSAATHMAAVEAGTWRKTRPLDEIAGPILDRIIADASRRTLPAGDAADPDAAGPDVRPAASGIPASVAETVDDIDSCNEVYGEGADDDIPSDTNIYDLMDGDA